LLRRLPPICGLPPVIASVCELNRAVFPGQAEGLSPESMNTEACRKRMSLGVLYLEHLRIWVPGSALRAAPE